MTDIAVKSAFCMQDLIRIACNSTVQNCMCSTLQQLLKIMDCYGTGTSFAFTIFASLSHVAFLRVRPAAVSSFESKFKQRQRETCLHTVDVARRFDGDNVGVGCEDLVQNRTVILAFHILVILQWYDVFERERLSSHRVLVELSDICEDVAEIIHCPIRSASLQINARLNLRCSCCLLSLLLLVFSSCCCSHCL